MIKETVRLPNITTQAPKHRGKGQYVMDWDGKTDLWLGRVTGIPVQHCRRKWTEFPQDMTADMPNLSPQLLRLDSNGDATFIPAYLTGWGPYTMTLRIDTEVNTGIFEGNSGSFLFSDGNPIGMVQSTLDGSSLIALRADRILSLAAEWVEAGLGSTLVHDDSECSSAYEKVSSLNDVQALQVVAESCAAGPWGNLASHLALKLSQLNTDSSNSIYGIENEKWIEGVPGSAFSIFKECEKCPDMVVLPNGEFYAGSPVNEIGRNPNEIPQKKISVDAFAIGRTEITFKQWSECVKSKGCKGNPNPSDNGWGKDGRPVINVSWEDALEYIDWLNREVAGSPYYLPEGHEWEYAARADTVSIYWTGETINTENTNFDNPYYSGYTVPALNHQYSNSFNLHHMIGNVWEWTTECEIMINEYPISDSETQSVHKNCERRALRGGAWNVDIWQVRSAAKLFRPIDSKWNNIGFRVSRKL